MLVQHLTLKAEELRLRVLTVYARGTSRYAYDGSGKVVHSKENAQLATFATGWQCYGKKSANRCPQRKPSICEK